MYLSHYNLKEKPFQITSDPKFLWLGEKHQEALSILKYGVMENKGFLLLTGEVGTGKTVLINRLVTMVDVETIVATIPDPDLEIIDFYNFLSDGFSMNKRFERKGEFLLELRNFLHNAHAENRKVLLIIDEAQRLSSVLLEEIRLLSNIDLHDKKLINIFFVGQDEFHRTLLDSKNRAVAQRITVRYNIEPLTETETGEYIQHRLKIAGTEKKIFKSSAIHEIYSFSRGVPRLINIICDHSLLTGYAREKKSIDAGIIKECAEELRIPVHQSKDDERLLVTLESIKREIAEGLRQGAIQETGGKPEPEGESGTEDTKEAYPVEAKPAKPLEEKAPQAAPPVEKRPLWVKAGFVAVVAILVALGGYFLKSYQPQDVTQWKAEDLVPRKYKDSLHKKEQSLKAALSGKKPLKRIPPVKRKPAADSTGVSGKPAERRTGLDDPKGYLGGIKELMQRADGGSGKSGFAEHQTAKRTVPKKSTTVPPNGVEEKNDFSDLREMMAASGNKIIIPFGHDSNDIPVGYFNTLNRVAEFLIQHPETRLLIKGYTDSYGAVRYNMRISQFRASTIKSYLAGKGADPSKIETFGLGPENPIATNRTPEGRAENRRVELEFDIKIPEGS